MEHMKMFFWPLIISFLSTVILMPFIIRYFRAKQLGQITREEGPTWHETKDGTPTMGGVVFICAIVLTTMIYSLITSTYHKDLWLLTIVFLLYGLIGFIDDFIKLFLKRNLGLTSRQKFLSQVVIAVMFYIILFIMQRDNLLTIPVVGTVDLSYFYSLF